MDQPPARCATMALSKSLHFAQSPRLADILAPKQNSFGVIRLAMAIAVLVSHSYWFTTGSKVADPLVRWTGHSIGEHAVQVFFFLSGILVTQSLLRSGSVLNYAVARALRIFPALIVCVLLTAFVLGPLFTQGSVLQYFTDRQLPLYIVKTLLLVTGSAPLPHLFHDQALPDMVNVSLWTLKYEVLCYISLGFIGYFGLLNERLRPYATALIILVVACVFVGRPKPLDTYTFVDNLRYFVLYFYGGVAAFLLRNHIRISGLLLMPLALAYAMAMGTRFGELACCLFLGYATLWFATMRFGGLRAFTNENDYSYGVYIFAGPIQQLVISAAARIRTDCRVAACDFDRDPAGGVLLGARRAPGDSDAQARAAMDRAVDAAAHLAPGAPVDDACRCRVRSGPAFAGDEAGATATGRLRTRRDPPAAAAGQDRAPDPRRAGVMIRSSAVEVR